MEVDEGVELTLDVEGPVAQAVFAGREHFGHDTARAEIDQQVAEPQVARLLRGVLVLLVAES